MAKLALERLIPVAHADAPERTGGVRRLPVHALRELIDALPEPIYVKDRSHRWVLVNVAFCEYIERNAADLLGKTERDFLSAQEAGSI
ncbi:MAG: PAS domain-containing protein [Gammaproteobacteria bacterium]